MLFINQETLGCYTSAFAIDHNLKSRTSYLAIDGYGILFIHLEKSKTPVFIGALFILYLQTFFWSFHPWPNINQETEPLGSWHTVHQPRRKSTWVMAYCSWTTKHSQLGDGILLMNQETKPLGSWQTVHQPRNKATWVTALPSKQIYLGHGNS